MKKMAKDRRQKNSTLGCAAPLLGEWPISIIIRLYQYPTLKHMGVAPNDLALRPPTWIYMDLSILNISKYDQSCSLFVTPMFESEPYLKLSWKNPRPETRPQVLRAPRHSVAVRWGNVESLLEIVKFCGVWIVFWIDKGCKD